MEQVAVAGSSNVPAQIQIVRHSQVKQKLQVSSSKLYDMVARGQFPKPFLLVPNGRSVGWIERDIDQWILERKKLADEGGSMKDDFIIYRDQSDVLHAIDPSKISHTDDLSPIMLIAAAVINAGYAGVIVDEQRLANGRIFQALNTNIATPEGRILAALSKVEPAKLPTPKAVLKDIRRTYRNGEGAE